MLSTFKKICAVFCVSFALQASADDRPIQYPEYNSALTVSGYMTQSMHSTHKPGWGIGGEGIYSRDFFNNGMGFKYFPEGTDDAIVNLYLGTGYKRYLQFQVGYGTEGSLYRFRSENDLAYLWVLGRHLMNLDLTLPTRYENYPNNRFVVIVSAEKYDNRRFFDNVSVGLGLRY